MYFIFGRMIDNLQNSNKKCTIYNTITNNILKYQKKTS